MKAKYIKYLIEGVKAEEWKKAEKKIAEVEAKSDKRYEWWQEEETKRKALEAENDALKAELADAKNVIAGYKAELEKDLGLSSEEEQDA